MRKDVKVPSLIEHDEETLRIGGGRDGNREFSISGYFPLR
jgi:hypothetical protein